MYAKWDKVAASYLSVFDDMLASVQAPTRITTPTYRKADVTPSPVTNLQSAPVPFSIKADLNSKKGEITSWLSMYNDPATGQRFLDSYLDYTEPGFMTASVKELNAARKQSNNPYLCLYLYQHQKHDVIGGVLDISENSQGYIYTAKMNMQVQRGREAFALAEEKMLSGSSYGYNARKYSIDEKGNRHLLDVEIMECSIVSYPANPHARVLDAKSKHYVPHSYGRIEELSAQMQKAFDDLDRLEKQQGSSSFLAFPELPEMEYDISDLLAEIKNQVR